jgi:hypothetical protein
MRIGILKETKTPEDNRVALTPLQIHDLQQQYDDVEFFVQSSATRSYKDQEYRDSGIVVKDDVSDCDILMGIKEAEISTLIPDKHYFFMGHIAKMQPYNKPLLQNMMSLGITFSDYEYLVDDKGIRLCAFGWWAGTVGVYNTLRAYGLKYHLFELAKPDKSFTLSILLDRLCALKLPAVKIVLTGSGRVSNGARYVLTKMGVRELTVEQYLNDTQEEACFCVAGIEELVAKNDGRGEQFDMADFNENPHSYKSDFRRFYEVSDVLISCHFWAPEQPVYLDEADLRNASDRIRVIGDITCDIQGSIKSTLRASTHAEPFYDYNPHTAKEEPAFSDINNITVMAVDTCPNALALDTSRYFGETLSEYLFPVLLRSEFDSPLLRRATILKDGKITEQYSYMREYAQS